MPPTVNVSAGQLPLSPETAPDTSMETGGAAAWEMATPTPTTVRVALRAAPVFAATEYRAVPSPVPAPVVTVIHESVVVAVQAQLAADALTLTVPVPPVSVNDCDVGFTVNVHGGAAAWVTVNIAPAMVIVPVRAPPLLAATV